MNETKMKAFATISCNKMRIENKKQRISFFFRPKIASVSTLEAQFHKMLIESNLQKHVKLCAWEQQQRHRYFCSSRFAPFFRFGMRILFRFPDLISRLLCWHRLSMCNEIMSPQISFCERWTFDFSLVFSIFLALSLLCPMSLCVHLMWENRVICSLS